MKKLAGLILILILSLTFVSTVSAEGNHRVLLFGDSLTATNLNDWPNHLRYDHTVVAEGGRNSNWVLTQIEGMVASGEIAKYDTAVVWIGVNDPYQAVTGIPEIYRILHSYGIRIVGVTQYLHYCRLSQTTKEKIIEFNEIVKAQADMVLDFASDPSLVDSKGYITLEASVDCIHLDPATMTEIISSAVNKAIDKLYTEPTFVPTMTEIPMPTVTSTMTTVPAAGRVQGQATGKPSMLPVVVLILIILGMAIGGARETRK